MICDRWLSLAVKEAKKSTYYQKVGAVCFNKGKFISSGRNYPERSVKHHHPRFRKWNHSVHAEVDTIIKAKKDLKGCSILVVRVNRHGQFRYSRPCRHCMMYLRHCGIREVFYSNDCYPYIKREKI